MAAAAQTKRQSGAGTQTTKKAPPAELATLRLPEALSDRARGRGARSNESGRYEREARELVDDGWESLADLPALATQITHERRARSSPARLARYFL